MEEYILAHSGVEGQFSPEATTPLSRGLEESSLVTWIRAGGVQGLLAITTQKNMEEFGVACDGNNRRAQNFMAVYRELNHGPESLLSSFGHYNKDDGRPGHYNRPMGLKVDDIPVMYSQLVRTGRQGVIRVRHFGPASISLLGEYCEALFEDRNLIP